jgi:hypothetical protein
MSDKKKSMAAKDKDQGLILQSSISAEKLFG